MDDEPVAVMTGPKGRAEIFDRCVDGRLAEYSVRFNGLAETYRNIGEAYIAAGEKTGTKTWTAPGSGCEEGEGENAT